MTLEEFEKILNICYTTKVRVVVKRKKRLVVEDNVTYDEIARLIANEFGFILTDEERIT